MKKEAQLDLVLKKKLVAVVRSPDASRLVDVAHALLAGGIVVMEITFTVPDALSVLSAVRKALGDRILLGAGTVLDPETARAALLSGAEFIVSPGTNVEVIKLCRRYDKLVMPGAYTPTEIISAWEAGADVVKIFPADIGGPAYLKALAGPLPQVRMMPTGGVDLETARPFLAAGACALGVGGALVEKSAIETGNMDRIRELAQQFVAKVAAVN